MNKHNTFLQLPSLAELPRMLFEVMSDGVLVIDQKGIIIDCNPALHQRLGYSKEEMLGRRIASFDTPEFAHRVAERLGQIEESGETTFETAHYRRNGTVMPVEISARVCDIAGERYFFGVVRDISERKYIEAALEEGIEIYQAAINTPALGFWAVDTHGTVLVANDAYALQSGYSRDELQGMVISDFEVNETTEETQAHIEEVIAKGYARFRTIHRRKDGSIWPVEVISTFSPVHGGRFFGFLEDLSEKIEQEQRLELAAKVFETVEQAVVVTDAQYHIVSVNPATSRITGYSYDELRGQHPDIFASGRHEPEFFEQMWRTLGEQGHWDGEVWDRRKDGSVYPKWMTINVIRDGKGEVAQYVFVFSDITERKQTEELIWRQANYDALTGLANRTLFKSRLQQEMERQFRESEKIAVIYLDLDGFKDVNDSMGHAAGDLLLIEVARRLQGRCRKSDLVARLGGDEFTLMVVNIRQPEQVGAMAEEILDLLKQPIPILERQLHIGASIGIAIYPDDGGSVDEITKHADVAMYQAKARGKNDFQFFQPQMNAMAQHRLALIHHLHTAVQTQAFMLHFQPKVRLEDGVVLGMEALLRWPREDGTVVAPNDFIPSAEQTGLIIPLGSWALNEACRQTVAWNSRFDARLKVAVNLSARQFRSTDLVEDVLDTLQRTGLPAELLELEITESTLMDDVEEAIALMYRLREAGVSIAIDDFGTGYSSLSYLKRFPISTLKVDRSFVRELCEGSQDMAIIRATIDLATSLDLEVVAEGVENEGQLQLLQGLRCYCGQGYHIGRPLDAGAFEAFLQERQPRLLQ